MQNHIRKSNIGMRVGFTRADGTADRRLDEAELILKIEQVTSDLFIAGIAPAQPCFVVILATASRGRETTTSTTCH